MKIGRLSLHWDKTPRVLGWQCKQHGPLTWVIWACPYCHADASPRYHYVNRFVRWLLRDRGE